MEFMSLSKIKRSSCVHESEMLKRQHKILNMSVTPLDMADIINLVEDDLSAVVICTKVPYLEQEADDTTRTQTLAMICEQYRL